MLARTATVLINKPTIDSTPVRSGGRSATTAPNTTSCWPVSQFSARAHAACSTVLIVVWWARAMAVKASVVIADSAKHLTSLLDMPSGSGGPTKVGASTSANTARQAVRARCWSCPSNQHTNLRNGTGAGSSCPP
ncbi:hypothetical protein MSIMFI_05614 [Mycobacterium simulans]|nr:hypothetical protein MSIMFI_05614 [Mycobacterium simulans]